MLPLCFFVKYPRYWTTCCKNYTQFFSLKKLKSFKKSQGTLSSS